jgi:hypothetical protein
LNRKNSSSWGSAQEKQEKWEIGSSDDKTKQEFSREPRLASGFTSFSLSSLGFAIPVTSPQSIQKKFQSIIFLSERNDWPIRLQWLSDE